MRQTAFRPGWVLVLGFLLAAAIAPLPVGAGGYRLVDPPRALGAVDLVAKNGRIDSASLAGRWTFLTLGFTHCPDICPTILGNLAAIRAEMAKTLDGKAIPRMVFVSVDSARDDPAYLAKYVANFGAGLVGATGSKAAIDALVKTLGAYYRPAGQAACPLHSAPRPEAHGTGLPRHLNRQQSARRCRPGGTLMDTAVASLLSTPALIVAALVLAVSAARADMIDSSAVPPREHCALCHGLNGISRMAKFPKLAGQRYAYLEKQLLDFKAARRVNDGGPMAGIVDQFGRDALLRAARWFSEQPAPAPVESEASRPAVGRVLFERGRPAVGVPACRTCHGATANRMLVTPRLEAQHPRYLAKQLRDFRSGARANDPQGVMRRIAKALDDADIAAVAGYLAARSRTPESTP